MSLTAKLLLKTMETGIVPERLIRCWMRHLCSEAVKRAALGDVEARHAVFRQLHKELKMGTALRVPNDDSLENPELEHDFFKLFLGKRLNTCCSYYPTGAEDLDEAEDTMLWMSADRARVREGMNILEVGCGWGAMSLWLAAQYPHATITALTDSPKKLIYIQKQLKEQNLTNVRVFSTDFEDFKTTEKFDRIICLERFDLICRLSNWEERISSLLKDDGKLFLQQPVHSGPGYYNESVGLDDMPGFNAVSVRLTLPSEMLLMFQSMLSIEDYWKIGGLHYAKTAESMLRRFYFNRMAVVPALEKIYGKKTACTWFQRWNLFLIALSEMSAFNRGQEWIVGQYLFSKRS